MTFAARGRELACSSDEPLVMAIVNASPESFSDGSSVGSRAAVVAKALEAVDAGAHLVDVGGESGVTNRAPLDPAEECRRVVPVVEELAGRGVAVSVDTWKPEVALACLRAGALVINDVSGLREPVIAEHCAAFGAALVVMHTRAAPKTKAFPRYADVVEDVVRFLRERVQLAVSLGVGRDALVLDPGPDFAKSPAETVDVLRSLHRVAAIGPPVLLALSRKDFVGALTGRMPRDRLGGSLAALAAGLDGGGCIVRVHDVAATVDFLRVRRALRLGDVDPALHLDESLRREPV